MTVSALSESVSGKESPGSTEVRCRVTPGGGDPRDSATESRPPDCASRKGRVKGWGKSPPRGRQRKRHGKPHREQDRIGTPCSRKRTSPLPGGSVRVGRDEASSNSRPRGMVIAGAFGNRHRTRLTGRLACHVFPRFGFQPNHASWMFIRHADEPEFTLFGLAEKGASNRLRKPTLNTLYSWSVNLIRLRIGGFSFNRAGH